MHSDRAIFSGI